MGTSRADRRPESAARGAEVALDPSTLHDAWSRSIDAFLDPGSPQRRRLDPPLAAAVRLSPPGLQAGLEAVLGGVAGERAAEVIAASAARRSAAAPFGSAAAGSPAGEGAPVEATRPPVLVVLAGNVPGLAVQPLLPALALGRRVILKASSAEPHFAPAFVAALARREPALGEAVTALAWRGGDREVEAPLLAECDPVLAYGDAPAIADLARRAAGRVVAYGPKTSLAVVGPGADPAAVAAGLARDVALFDQRGCLSIAAVYVAGEALAAEVAAELTRELARLADLWPPGPATTAELAAVRQARDETVMAGARLLPLSSAAGTVVIDPRPAFRPTPGRRTVRIHPLPDLAALPALLSPWSGRLQGLALTGLPAVAERTLRAALTPLGISHVAPPGRLQHPDTRWHNGGVDPLEILS